MSEATNQRSKKHVAIYFTPGSSEVMKALAGNVRSQGGKTVLVWSDRWNGPQNLMMEVRAVIIEVGCLNDIEIAQAYMQFTQDVEIHFVDSDGEFCAAPEGLNPEEESTDAKTETGEPDDGTEEEDSAGTVDGPADVPEQADDGEATGDSADSDGAEPENERPESVEEQPEAEPDSAEGASGDELEK